MRIYPQGSLNPTQPARVSVVESATTLIPAWYALIAGIVVFVATAGANYATIGSRLTASEHRLDVIETEMKSKNESAEIERLKLATTLQQLSDVQLAQSNILTDIAKRLGAR